MKSESDEARRPGYTLVEVVVVMAIMAILMTMAVPSYRRSVEQARADMAAANLRTLWAAERLFYLDARAYTEDAGALAGLGVLEEGLLASDEMYSYQITYADPYGFTATATRIGSTVFGGTLGIDQTGTVTGMITDGSGAAITPGFR
jgi:prepilin-type N-terminal cleavage/methylation domain-containing protein